MMEAAAGPMGWWRWQWSGGRSIPSVFTSVGLGISPWFMLGTDFFLVWFLFFNARLKNRWWALLGLLPFPVHYGLYAVGRFHLGQHVIDSHQIAHFLMISLAIVLPFFFQIEPMQALDYAKPPKDKKGRWLARLDLIALGVMVATVCLGLIFYAQEGELALFALPLIAAGLFGWWRSERGSS